MSKPTIMCCQPIDKYFFWQIHLYVESCINAGFDEERIHILLYKPTDRVYDAEYWERLTAIYPKLKLFVYEDRGVQQHLGVYIPILRPHILWQHFLAFPELEKETIIYTDCDILWTKTPDIEKFYDNDECYISDASSYMNYSYFESKIHQVLPEKKEEYIAEDVIQKIADIVGISVDKIKEENNNTGGVQYLLKGVNAEFWKKVEKDVLALRVYLLDMNKKFYKDESAGWQSWCADLWAVLWNLWYLDKKVNVVPEMSFSWATDTLDKIDKYSIFHNAGIASVLQDGHPCFYKGKYHRGEDPTKDPYLDEILNNEESRKFCTWFYANELKKLSDKYHLDY